MLAVLAGPVNQVVTPYVPPDAHEGEAVDAQDGAGEGCEREDARRRGRGEDRPGDAGGRAARVLDGGTAHEARACPHDPTARAALPSLWTVYTTPEQLGAIDGHVADG